MADVQGAQVVGRIGRIMRAVGENAGSGIPTSEVARVTGLTRPTTHRLLNSLAAEGFLDHDSQTARWHLGPELFLLGSLASERYDITDLARESVELLARETGESAFLSARRGYETVCLLREEGSFPVRSFVLYEGVRFPLGVASAGIAILAFLGPKEVDEYLAHGSQTERWGEQHSPAALRRRIDETRSLGYAVNPGLIVEGSWGMGAAVFDRHSTPTWALSLTGIESRFSPRRRPELGRLLLEQAHVVTKRLHDGR
ncbi:IclR family transcriptional regulator [Subtercola boreus]|uniref:IclR family transcriptional regulator n=1 Tax=Subtercola boreus TaxID=120213 RepID=A0A3E0W9W5_9MICO|nr:IclR family transcriptional regulator [Subtercola boreus]RFA18147.1 IclR family transcriptional regulator [Subtercola boreus]RFA18529.1 IclR family transcriptional regulator [Subtercola boreus]RFA25057.1 IclR family transcriptional regulator [Subtercola boreus]